MAINDTTGNPWRFDDADVGVITTEPLKISKMVWTPEADGDDILVTDNSGHYTWSLKAIASTSDEEIEYIKEINGSVNGFNLVTMDSGTLYVYQ
jgi:hypothetical protein